MRSDLVGIEKRWDTFERYNATARLRLTASQRRLGFSRYFLRRLLLVIPTLVGVTLITFTLTYLLPGNPGAREGGAAGHARATWRSSSGRWASTSRRGCSTGATSPASLRGDLGESSSTGRPVLEDFRQRLPATLELTLASLSDRARRRHSARRPSPPSIATPRSTTSAASSAWPASPCRPSGPACCSLYVFFYLLGRGAAAARTPRLRASTPPQAITGLYVVDSLLTGNWRRSARASHQLMLPAFTLGLSVMAPLARMVRSTMLEILESDYIKAAWAAGHPAAAGDLRRRAGATP